MVTNEALCQLHALLLQDIRPPWVDNEFGLPLPEDTTLSRYSRPTFLRWDRDIACLCFGPQVVSHFDDQARGIGLTLKGFVGRLLYLCTALKATCADRVPKDCMNIASMSHLL